MEETKIMKKEIIKKEIRYWFENNRPDITHQSDLEKELTDKIYSQIEKDIASFSNDEDEALLIILYEFLRIYYSSSIFIVIEEIIKEDNFKDYFESIKKIDFLYKSEINEIMNKISEKQITENYGFDTSEIIKNETFREEVREVVQIHLDSNSK